MSAEIKTISIRKDPSELCPNCGAYMKFVLSENPHGFSTLNGEVRTVQCFYYCENEHRYTPLNPYVFPYKKFGIDVYAHVIYQRFKKNRTAKEIKGDLWENYRIKIGEETIRRIFIFYLQLQAGEIPQDKIEEMKKNDGIILSTDASKPLKNTPPLYIFRDVLTSTTLASEFITPATKDNIKEMLVQLKDR